MQLGDALNAAVQRASNPTLGATIFRLPTSPKRPAEEGEVGQQQTIAAEHTSITFLKALDEGGWHNLVAMHPRTSIVVGRTFAPGTFGNMAAWVEAHEGEWNLYYSVNEPTAGAPHNKLGKHQIRAIRAIFADKDPVGDRGEARAALSAQADEIDVGPLPASFALDSGNSQQWIWKLREKLAAEECASWAEAQGRAVAHALGGDCVQNIDRIMRLPGTTNHPSPEKLAKGRLGGPVRLTHRCDVTYSPEEISAHYRPIYQLERAEADAAIAAAIDEIDLGEAMSRDNIQELPPPLLAKLQAAIVRDQRFAALLKGAPEVAPRDTSASGWRAAMAAAVGRLGDFTVQDYADICGIWRPGEPTQGELTERALAREWVRIALVARNQADPTTYFTPVEGDVDTSHFERLQTSTILTPVGLIDPCLWAGQPIPPRRWEVPNLIPHGEVTLLYGDGGVGKTLLAQQFATCAATGTPWLGMEVRKTRVVCFFCEDDAPELQRRQHDINRQLGVDFPALGDLRLSARKGADNLLAVWDRSTGIMRLTETWHWLRDQALAFGATVVIVDTLADIFAGSEIDRAQVSAFVKNCLWRLAHEIGGTVIALGHPSMSGKASGEGTSGSLAWNNACRSRLYLRYPDQAKGNKSTARAHSDLRELENMKLNYGPRGSRIKLRWVRGAFEPLFISALPAVEGERVSVPTTEDAALDALVVAIGTHPHERLTTAANSRYFAPKILRELDPDGLSAFSSSELTEALLRLQRAGALDSVEVGKDASSRPIYGLRVNKDRLSSEAFFGREAAETGSA